MALTEESPASGERDELERLAEEFAERRRRGDEPTIDEYVAAHPHLADEIRGLFATLIFVEDLGVDTCVRSVAAPAATPPAAPELKQVGEYRILREIGRGGMGIVYEAEQASLGRRVALKVLPFHFLLDAKRLERFYEEARAAGRLSHHGIVPIHGVGEHLGLHYYVMQLIPGQGLNRVIEEVRRQRREGEPKEDSSDESSSSLARGLDSSGTSGGRGRYYHNIARLMRDAAQALQYAHGEGILHRDVKPSNLLLDPGGRIWLTDFGLAKAEGSADLTHTGDFVGTALYMAPERFKGWSDPRSDIYALGVTLYELATLRPLFVETDRAELLRKLVSAEPTPPRRIDPTIPRDLETVILKAIAKDPAQRYLNAQAMAEDLDRLLSGLPIEARRAGAFERLWKWCARNPLQAVSAALILFLLLAVAVVSTTLAARLSGKQADLLSEQEAGQENLRAAYLVDASAIRASAQPGRRLRALDALHKAAAIRVGPDLVDEALACFALMDLRSVRSWPAPKDQTLGLTPDGGAVTLVMPSGEVVFNSTQTGEELFSLPAPEFRPSYVSGKFNRSGRLLAVRYEQGERRQWKVWDLHQRRLVAEMKDGGVKHWCDFAPDDSWLVLTTKARTIRILDLETGAVAEEFGQGLMANAVAVHPGGRLIAFSSELGNKVYIYDRGVRRVVRTLSALSGEGILGIAWHPNGRVLAGSGLDHDVSLWSVETGERLQTLQGHWAEAFDVGYHANGLIMATSGWEPSIRFWDTGSNRPVFSVHHRLFGFGSKPDMCWTIGVDRVEQWELSANLSAFTLLGHEGSSTKHPHDVALSSEGRLAATAGDEGVRLWDLARRMELCHLVDRKVRGVYFGSNPRSIITFGSSGLRRWPIHAMDDHSLRLLVGPVEQLNEAEAVYSAAADRAGITVAGVQDGGTVCWQDLESGRSLLFPGPGNPTAIEVSPDGRLLAMACAEGNEVTIWPTETLASLAKLGGSNDGGAAGASSAAPQPLHRIPAARANIKFHPGGTHILTCTPQEYAYWKLGKAEALWRIPRQISLQYSVRSAFSDDGRTVAVAYNDSKIWLVETSSGDKLAELEAPEHIQISGLAMAGGRLAASTVGRRFHVWDLNCMAGELTQLGLRWRVPTQGAALEGAAPLHAFVAGNSLRTLRGESAELFERQLFRPRQRVPYLPELLSCADLDEAIEDFRYLVAEHDAWRYLRGFSEPSPGLEWTDRAFDDKTWLRGQSPLTGWNTPAAIEGTLLSDQVGGYTSLYLRASFEVADPSAVSRLILSIELEDGCVAFLNGTEVGRSNAGKAGEPFTCHSLAGQFYRRRCVEVFELSPKQLVAGVNQLALQARTYDPTSKVYATPVLAAVMAPSADGDRKRTLNVAAGSDGAPEASLAAYRQGRILQRSSQWAEASLEFERAGRLDRVSVEPTLRRAACYRALGEPRRAESVLREAIEGGSAVDRIRLWRAWFATIALDLKLSPSEALAEFPHERRSDSSVESADSCDIRWLLSELAAGRPLRLRCGGPELKTNAGTVWSGDAFFLGGASSPKANAGQATSAQADGDRALYAVFRSFSGRLGGFLPAYSIPLPPGRYSVTLHFAETQHHEPRKRNFDIFLEEHAVFDGYDPYAAGAGRPDAQTFDVEVVDGALDLAFRRHIDTARICAIEVVPRTE